MTFSSFIGGAALVIGILIAFGPQTLFPVCPPMEHITMKCHSTARVEFALGLLVAVLGLLTLLTASASFRCGLTVSIFLNAVLALLIPAVLVGVCPGAHMGCRSLTLPALVLLSGLLATGAAASIGLYWRRGGEKKNG
ncbi:hypothetical protein FACS1894139_09880 [Planctomycetales bacterium]|nr:hypothetical protein FACS1894107_01820 [Planctomycetales bacterium]GHS97187.1 hypothetical protein FACS1894108_03130 [Planctomycetales bacterium]GHT05662.1 hypothetical protein FACS1894139_09880 [Planctomycetales bacterium]